MSVLLNQGFIRHPPILQNDNRRTMTTALYGQYVLEDENFVVHPTRYWQMCRNMINDRSYAIQYLKYTKGLNVVVVPSCRMGYVRLVHTCIDQVVTDPSSTDDSTICAHYGPGDDTTVRTVIGSCGNRFNSQLVSFNYNTLIHPLKPQADIANNLLSIPTIEDMVDQYVLGNDFQRDLDNHPFNFHAVRANPNVSTRLVQHEYKWYLNSQFLHPETALFPRIGLPDKEMDVNELVHYIIQMCLFDQSVNDWVQMTRNNLEARLERYYHTFVYFWLIGNGFGRGYVVRSINPNQLSEENDNLIFNFRQDAYAAMANEVLVDDPTNNFDDQSLTDSD